MSTNIDHLPPEVLEMIFAQIFHPLDRRRIALVCRKFHRILRNQSRQTNRLKIPQMGLHLPPLSTFKDQDFFPFSKTSAKNDFHFYTDFWLHFGPQIKEMDLEVRDLDLMLENLSKFFPNLEKLKMSQTVDELKPILKHRELLSVEELDLSGLRITSDDLDSTLKCFPQLRCLKIDFAGVTDFFASQTFPAQLNALFERVDRLEFSVGFWEMAEAFEVVSRIFTPVEKVFFAQVDLNLAKETEELVQNFFEESRMIRILKVYDSKFLNKRMVQRMKDNLQVEEIQFCFNLPTFDDALSEVSQLNGLKKIEIPSLSKSILLQLSDAPDSFRQKVHSVSLASDPCERQQMIFAFLDRFNNLQDLNLNTNSVITNEFLQKIIQNCTKLRSLKIQTIFAVTNEGLIGESIDWRPISDLNDLECLDFGFENLGGITDYAFEKVLRFPNLKEFSFGGIDELSIDGIEFLVNNCPKIEKIDIRYCNEVGDDCLYVLTKRLAYLSEIRLEDCKATVKKAEAMKRKFPHLAITLDNKII